MITAAPAPVFPGSTLTRADITAQMRQVDQEIKGGLISEQARRVYGTYDTVQVHDDFTRSFQKYSGDANTLGEMVGGCEQRKMLLEIKAARAERHEGKMFTLMIGGVFASIMGFVSCGTTSHPLIGAAVGVAGLAATVTGFRGSTVSLRSGSQMSKMDGFTGFLQRWAREMSLHGAPPPVAAAAPQPAVASGVPTGALSTADKKRLMEQLRQEIERDEKKPPGKIERREQTVQVDGVAIPIKPAR